MPDSWRGVFPSLCTPFDAGGAIDLAALERVTGTCVDDGAAGLVCFGLAGEVARLEREERTAALGAIVAASGQRPVLVGASAESTRVAVALAGSAAELGGAGVVIAPPVLTRMDAPALVDFFVEVADATELPVVVQDASAIIGVELSPEIVLRAAERAPNIRYVKVEASPTGLERWIHALGPGIGVFGGNAGIYLLDAWRVGACGVMPGSDLTHVLAAIWRAAQEGDAALAATEFGRILPTLLFQIQDIDHYNACAKRVLELRGVLGNTDVRAPARGLDASSEAALRAHLAAAGVELPALAGGATSAG